MIRHQPIGAVLLLALLLGAPATGQETEAPEFEIVVLGTYHAPSMFLGDSYTPAHIRATLENAKPDVVAVESHPEWFSVGRYHVVTYEAEGVAVPWARSKGLPVYGIDEKDIDAWDRRAERKAVQTVDTLRKELAPGAPLARSLFALGTAGGPEIVWEKINSEEYGKSRYQGKSPEDPDFAVPRDRGIARNVVEVMKKHPGKRIAVVIGAHHKPFLEILLRKRGRVRILELGKDVPYPTGKQLAGSWTITDLAATLAHNLESDGPVDLPRMRRLLAMLGSRIDALKAAIYFEAKVLIREGRKKKAERLLADHLDSKADLYPFQMRAWRMRYTLGEAARIETAKIRLARGEKTEAKALLEPVAAAVGARLARLEKDHEPVRRSDLALKDPGFEAGKRAGDMFAGWDVYLPTGSGFLRFVGDDEVKIEGKRSLRIEVTEANPRGHGFYIRQAAQMPPLLWKGGDLTFGLSLRGEKVDSATLMITSPWYGKYQILASKTVALKAGEWTRAEVSCPLPEKGDFYVKLKFDGPTGAKLWMDAGTAIPLEYDTVPEEWPILARAAHYPRFLLSAP